MSRRLRLLSWCVLLVLLACPSWAAQDRSTPEAVLRALVQANADRDLPAMAALMAHDADAVGYSIGGRKYVGWEPFAREMKQEFADVEKLEIPITELTVWTRGDVAWFAMELDYIRYVRQDGGVERTVLPLRETGVLERRDGRWVVVAWHESKRREPVTRSVTARPSDASLPTASVNGTRGTFDLSGEWTIEEEDKAYTAVLDRHGNGTYSHQGGRFETITFEDRRLLGRWTQPGNDREGGFEVVFSEDGREARGIWWYTRVGSRENIPPRQHGGTYVWTRRASADTSSRSSR